MYVFTWSWHDQVMLITAEIIFYVCLFVISPSWMNALEDTILSILCSDVFLSITQDCDQHIIWAVSLFFNFPGFFFLVVIVLKFFLFLTYDFYSLFFL